MLGLHWWGLAATICLATAGSAQLPVTAQPDTLYLTHFDVGQGDATLITTPRGRRILIDAGGQGDSIAARIKRAGVDTIDLLVSTHNHQDHIGGIPDVFATFVVRRYLDNNMRCTTQICLRTSFAASTEADLVHIESGIGDTIDGVFIRYLPLPPRDSAEENNNSVGVIIQFGNFRALYTGDSQLEELDWWLGQDIIPRVNVFKAPHHGSINGFSEEWQQTTRPMAVVVSVGKNGYGHPSPQVMQAWAARGAKVFRTDYLGTVQINVVRDGNFNVTFPRFGERRP